MGSAGRVVAEWDEGLGAHGFGVVVILARGVGLIGADALDTEACVRGALQQRREVLGVADAGAVRVRDEDGRDHIGFGADAGVRLEVDVDFLRTMLVDAVGAEARRGNPCCQSRSPSPGPRAERR